MANYYEILGVKRNSDEDEIQKSFRKLARKYHPDLNPGDKSAEKKFKQINEAYQVLSDKENRSNYDRYGDNWKHAEHFKSNSGFGSGFPFTGSPRRQSRTSSGSAPNIEDLFGGFGDLFGQRTPRKQSTQMETNIKVSLEEAFLGVKRRITMSLGHQKRRIEVTIPPGVDTGSVVKVKPDKSPEVLLKIIVSPHKHFTRKGNDLFADVLVLMEDAILGGEVESMTLTGKVRVIVPAESQNGQKIRLAGQGMPKLGQTKTRGDLYLTIRPDMPENLTDEQKKLIEQFKKIRDDGR